jgi:hypothetical protein
MLIGIAVIIMLVALVAGWLERRQKQDAFVHETLARRKTPRSQWLRAGVLLLAEMAGVAASLYITRALVPPDRNPVVLSILIACANFGGSFVGHDKDAPLSPQDLFVFFKDGLLWPAALPAIAETLRT